MNFRWLASQAGSKVHGAWFDHIECQRAEFHGPGVLKRVAGPGKLTLFQSE